MLTEDPDLNASVPTGMCGSPTKCTGCPSTFLCFMKAKQEQESIDARGDCIAEGHWTQVFDDHTGMVLAEHELLTASLDAHRHAMEVFDAAEADDLVAVVEASTLLIRVVADMQQGLKLLAAARVAGIQAATGIRFGSGASR